jgi:hypothetical protein
MKNWRWYGRHLRMSQGLAQFFRRQSFEQIGGYDELLKHVWLLAISIAINVSAIMKRAGGRSHERSIATF